MATYTSKLNLKKPAQTDFYNIEDFNANADKIDEAIHSKVSKLNALLPSDLEVLDTLTTEDYAGNWGWLCPENTPFGYPNGALCVVTNDIIKYVGSIGVFQTIKPVYPTPNCDEIYTRAYYYGNEHSGGNVWTEWKKFAIADEFLPISGGTINGNLRVKGDWFGVSLQNANDTKRAIIELSPSGGMALYAYTNELESNKLSLAPETTDISKALLFSHKRNGSQIDYKIFGEHNLPNAAQVFSGTYGGNGNSGSAYANILPAFNFTPKIVIIEGWASDVSHNYKCILFNGNTVGVVYTFKGASGYEFNNVNVTWTNNTVQWYVEGTNTAARATSQLNKSGTTYQYIAIG